MDEVWERAVESALESQPDSSSSSSSSSSIRTLTLDGAVKCLHGRLPPPNLLEKYQNLEHLSIANIGLSSLEKFPKLGNLQRLILSDNRIAGGLEFLVEAGLDSLRDLDLSNNRIQFVEDLAPLADLRLVSLDLYECPVTRVKDYRSRVFAMIQSLKYLDKMDADENERPESDDDDEEDDVGDDDDDEIDDGEVRGRKVANGIVDSDEDESDADEEVSANVSHHHQDLVDVDVDDEDDEEEDEDGDRTGEEIDADDGEDEDVVEVHGVGDDDNDGVEEDDDDGDDEVDGDEEDVEDVEDDEEQGGTGINGGLVSAEGEIDGHDQGEEDRDSENGEIGEVDEDRDSDGEDEEEDVAGEYLVQPIAQPERGGKSRGDSDACNEEDDDEEEVDDEESQAIIGVQSQPSSSSEHKRKWGDDSGDLGDNGDLGDDSVEEADMRSSKHH